MCQLSSSGCQFNLPNVASTMFWIILYVWMYLIFSFLCIQLGIKLQTNMKSRCAVIGHYQLGWFIRFPVRMGSKPQHLQVQVYLVNVSRLTKQPIPHLFIHSYAYRLVTKMNGHTPQLNHVADEILLHSQQHLMWNTRESYELLVCSLIYWYWYWNSSINTQITVLSLKKAFLTAKRIVAVNPPVTCYKLLIPVSECNSVFVTNYILNVTSPIQFAACWQFDRLHLYWD